MFLGDHMMKLILAVVLSATFTANARTRLEKIKNLDREAYIKIYKAQVEFILEWEKNNTKFPNFSSDSEKVSFIHKNLNSWSETFLSSAFAAEGAACFFGGWPSKIGANGKCRLPWQTRAYSKSLGLPEYGPACGGTLFRCNPSLFGGKGKAPCVESSGGYKDVTKSCQEKITEIAKKDGKESWLESLSDQEFEEWVKGQLIPLQSQIAKFCSGSNEPYNDKTCETLNGVVKKAADEAARRIKKLDPQVECKTPAGKIYKNDEKETQKFYQKTESETCPSVEKSRLCKNGKWEEWVGDKSFVHPECKTKSAPASDVVGSSSTDSPAGQSSNPQVSDVRPEVTIPQVPLTEKKPVLGSVELGGEVEGEEGGSDQPKPEVTIPKVPLTEKKPILGPVILAGDDADESSSKSSTAGINCGAIGEMSQATSSAGIGIKCGEKIGYIKNDTKLKELKVLVVDLTNGKTREVVLKDPPGNLKDYSPLINNDWVRMKLDLKDGESVQLAENGLVFDPETMLYEDKETRTQVGTLKSAPAQKQQCWSDGTEPFFFSYSDGCGQKKMCLINVKCKMPNLNYEVSARAFCKANIDDTCPGIDDCAADADTDIKPVEKDSTQP